MSISSQTLVTSITTALSKQDKYNEQKYAQKTDIATVLKFKGTVANFAALPLTGNTVGDVYNIQTVAEGTTPTDINGDVIKAGDNVAYVTLEGGAAGWDALGGVTDLSNYATKTELTQSIGDADETVSAADIEAAVAAANPGITLPNSGE